MASLKQSPEVIPPRRRSAQPGGAAPTINRRSRFGLAARFGDAGVIGDRPDVISLGVHAGQ